MADQVVIGRKSELRRCGCDERWLEAIIAKDPTLLPLGKRGGEGLRLIENQHSQNSGGRLDLLLEDTEADGRMYEVELMLGEVDASHIIRTIEYWDHERRRFPKRSHTAVLVAETINNRFFNVIRLLGDAIPIIAIQMDAISADGKQILHFSKVLDNYVEADTEKPGAQVDDRYWEANGRESLRFVEKFKAIFPESECGKAHLHFTQNYVNLQVTDECWVWFHKRANGKTRVNFWFIEPFMSEAVAAVDKAGIEWERRDNYKDGFSIYFTMDPDDIERNAECLKSLCILGRKSIEAFDAK